MSGTGPTQHALRDVELHPARLRRARHRGSRRRPGLHRRARRHGRAAGRGRGVPAPEAPGRRAGGCWRTCRFSDLLLYVPLPAHDEGRNRYLVVNQVRPNTGQTLFLDDVVGRTMDATQRPIIAQAAATGEIVETVVESMWLGERLRVTAIPVRFRRPDRRGAGPRVGAVDDPPARRARTCLPGGLRPVRAHGRCGRVPLRRGGGARHRRSSGRRRRDPARRPGAGRVHLAQRHLGACVGSGSPAASRART